MSWRGVEWLEGLFLAFIVSERVPDAVDWKERPAKWRDGFTVLCASELRLKLRAYVGCAGWVDWGK